jgi:serine/threonine protein kinase/Tol biopolymer transport system component
MTPERWKAIERLYHAAAERAPDDRARFLAQACAGDDELRQQVLALLDEDVLEEGFAEGPALSSAAGVCVDRGFGSLCGQSVGGYHLQELLGRGGMGEVYRAQDPKLGRDVAIKILPPAFTSDPQRLARFEREARMLAALNHPNICAIYGIEEAGPLRYLILEIVEGRTLAETLAEARSNALPLRDVLAIARQISDALEAAHEKGIVHRDLKPANIKITPEGVVKVLDFGLAKPTVATGASDLTDGPMVINARRGEGPVIGTAAYMSPEQARGLAVDKRSDIWAFGCVLYEMLAGRLAFAGETVSDTIARILEREPVWSALPGTTPPAVRRLLLRCLMKDPKERLRDIGDARIEIGALDEILPGVPPIPAGPRRRWPAALGVTAAVTSALVVLTSWLAINRSASSIENRLATAKYSYVTEWEGVELDAAISADGKFAAFVADASGAFQIWLTQLGTGTFRNLTPDQQDERNRLNRPVGFSVDGSTVWISGSPAGRRLRTMPFTGGPLREFLDERAINVAWSADNSRAVYLRADTDGDPLFVGDRSGGNARQILPGKEGEHNHFPTWSTDGQWIYYVHFVDEAMSADLWRVRSSGGAPERLTEQYRDVRHPTPIDTRTVLYVARDDTGGGPWLWALDVVTKARVRVSVGPERYLSVAASADGRRLIATIGRSTASLWSIPLSNGVADERDVTRYAVSPARAFAPRFGSTGLFYLSSTGSGDGLWRTQGETSVEIWKASDGVLSDPVAIAPNGRMAITLRSEGRAHLVLVSSDGAVRRSVADTVEVRGTASWSPDANWIVTAGRDSAGPGLFKIPADGGPPVRLANGQALDPVWSPDGGLIVYAGPLSKATAPLLAVRPDGRAVALPPIRTSAQGGGCVRFLPDGTGLVYSLGPVGKQGLWLLDLATNETRLLARLPGDATTSSFDVTPDGKRIVFDRLRELSDIVLIDLKD